MGGLTVWVLIVVGFAGWAVMLEAIRRMVATDTRHPIMWTAVMAASSLLGVLSLAAASSGTS